MAQALPYLLGFVLPLVLLAGVALGGGWLALPAAFLFIAVPLADSWIGRDPGVEGGDSDALERNPWFRAVVWLWVPVQLSLLAWGAWLVAAGRLAAVETVGFALATGVVTGGVGITFAHELIHRPGRGERGLGELLLASVGYTHFAIEHVHGHHRHVATPADPATARFGESLYAFVLRSVGGGLQSAWRIERRLLARRGRGVWHPSNRMLRYAATLAAVYATAAWLAGAHAVAYLALQSVVAVVLLETINYVEHYGLERRLVEPGRYERTQAHHSWDSSHRVSNWLLINLARHADHHVTARKRYPTLATLDGAPQLPASYGAMVMLALVPRVWRRVMDPRVVEWRQRHAAD